MNTEQLIHRTDSVWGCHWLSTSGEGYKRQPGEKSHPVAKVLPFDAFETFRPLASNSRMNLSATFYFTLALIFFTVVADADCNQNGCCYCGSQNGLVIETRSRFFAFLDPDCDPGYDCQCGYNSNGGYYFGVCVGGTWDRLANNAAFYEGGKWAWTSLIDRCTSAPY